MYTEGILKLAGMNQGDQQWRDSSIRGDYHAWVNDRHQVKLVYPSLGALLGAMDDIKTELNENCAFGSEKTQVSNFLFLHLAAVGLISYISGIDTSRMLSREGSKICETP
jgi:hypothetical protein